MRIALAVEGTRGDVHPMLSLGRAFRRLGHEAVLCGPPNFRGAARAAGIDFREVGTDTKVFLDGAASAVGNRGLASLRVQAAYFKDSIEKQFARLPDTARDCDLMLGAGVQLAGPSVAEFHGVPYRYVVYCPAMFPSSESAPPFVPVQGLPAWLNRWAWRLMLGPMDAILRFGINRARREHLGLAPIRSAYENLLSSAPILAADPVLAPLPKDTPVPVRTLGVFHDHEADPLPEKLEHFLAAGEKPVYVGFGSMTDPDPGATTRLIVEAVEQAGARAIVSRGWAGLGNAALPAEIIEIGPVCHAALFPRCAAVVHHGGAGTTARATRAGVPQIIVPHLLDQYWWGHRAQSLGLAPAALPRTGLAAGQLADALRGVMGNEFLAERAIEVGARRAPAPTLEAAARAILEESRA